MQLINPLEITRKYALTIATAFLLWPFMSTAQVYKSVDADGKVTFTDQPSAKAEAVDVSTPNTVPAVTAPNKPAAVENQETGSGYTSVSITGPADNSIIANGLLPSTVTANTRPALQEGHKLQLNIDGKPHSTSAGSFTIDSMRRGEHQFQVVIIDEDKQVLKRSASVKVFVYRPGN